MGLRVKICGITQVDQGRAIAEMGATALGFICVQGTPRYVDPTQIRAIVAELPIDAVTQTICCDRVGVFLNHDLQEICQVVTIANLNAVQLHGMESPEFCQTLRSLLPEVEIIKVIRVRSLEALESSIAYVGAVDTLLLDAYHPNLPGGTGKTLDWQKLQQFQPDAAWFLSGGLTPDNVLEALQLVKPHGIDLSSGVERAPGDKDLDQVARLFSQLCRGASRSDNVRSL